MQYFLNKTIFSRKLAKSKCSIMPHPMTYFSPTFPHPNFTGKELDEETGYGYFGARYMDHELMTGWLSVDPMADKYPSMSPYNYCAWNPLKLVDPDGNDWYEAENGAIKWTDCHNQNQLKKSGVSGLYLGVTAEADGKYYSLFHNVENGGKPLDLNSVKGKFVKHMDQAIIKRAMTSAFDENAIEDFGDLFSKKFNWKSDPVKTMDYAGGKASVMNSSDMTASFNPQSKDNILGGPNAGKNAVNPPRFDFRNYRKTANSKDGVTVVSLSFYARSNALKQFTKTWDFLSSRKSVYTAKKTCSGWESIIYSKPE